MTRSLKVENGDLAVQGGSFVLLSRRDKLEQDLIHWLRTEIGSDRFHPTFGSTIEQFIGAVQSEENIDLLKSEVKRVLGNYQESQLRKFLENRSRFTAEEILSSVDRVEVSAFYDSVDIRIVAKNLRGQTTDLSLGVTT